jgi:hypothetical protein
MALFRKDAIEQNESHHTADVHENQPDGERCYDNYREQCT